MTRIDFYLLSSDQPDTRLAYACRLAHKAWHKGHKVYPVSYTHLTLPTKRIV